MLGNVANWSDQGDDFVEAATVRPYAVTGGRVRSATSNLPLETLIEVMPGTADVKGITPEKRAILNQASEDYVSIAEISAFLKMPLGVIRILVADLADEGYILVHTSMPVNVHTGHSENPALSLSVLESVLNGIASL